MSFSHDSTVRFGYVNDAADSAEQTALHSHDNVLLIMKISDCAITKRRCCSFADNAASFFLVSTLSLKTLYEYLMKGNNFNKIAIGISK